MGPLLDNSGVDAAYAEARRSFEGKSKPSTAPVTQPAQQPVAQSAPSGMTPQDFLRIAGFTAAAQEHGIPARGVEMLLGDFMTAKPTDARAWVAEQATAFGWSRPTTPTSTNPASAAAPAQAAANPPVTGNAAPSSAGRVTDDVPLIDRSPSDQDAFLRQHGFVKYTDRLLDESRANGTRLKLR